MEKKLGWMDSLARWRGLFLSTLAQRNVFGGPSQDQIER